MKTYLAYGQFALPLAIIGLPLYIYLPKYYADNLALNMAMVGIVLFVARFLDVITDPMIGYTSDKIQQKFNTRKPLVLIGSLLIVFSFYELINPIKGYELLSLFIFSTTIYLGWSMVNIVYLTWSSEIYDDNQSAAKLNMFRESFAIVGLVLAILIPYIFSVSSNTYLSLEITFVFFTLILFISVLIVLKFIRTNIKSDSFVIKISDVKSFYSNYNSLHKLQIGYFINNLANAIPASLFLYYVQFVLQEEEKSGILLLIYFISGIIALPIWSLVYKKIGKRKTWISSMVLSSSAFIIVPFLGEGDFEIFLIVCIVSGFSVAIDLALPMAIQGKFVQNNILNSKKNAAFLFSVLTMLTKLALASAVGITFVVLYFAGFDEQNPNSIALLVLALLYGFTPIVLKLISIYFIKNMK